MSELVQINLMGGLNLSESDQLLALGECTELVNYEITSTGRYKRMQGYERFDGQPAPSSVVLNELPGAPFVTAEEAIEAVKAAQEARRLLIGPVPGSGQVLGVFGFAGKYYAFRNTVDGLAAKMWRASETGWQEVSTPALAPNGQYSFEEANFTGSAGTAEVIGTDGRNPAFRFNGTTFSQITGPITPDQPTYCAVLASNVLLLAYRGGSFVFSAVGDPTKFSPVDGGGEIAVGQEITGVSVMAEGTCAVFCRNKTYVLYGKSSADFQLTSLALNAGAISGTIQQMSMPVYLDDGGIKRLDRVQQFGDFENATISQKVQNFLTQRVGNSCCTFTVKSKNQYRLFFGDQTGLCLTMFGSDVLGFTEMRIGFTPRCAWSGEADQGEIILAGAEDGYVYQMDSGNSHDGQSYPSWFQTGFMAFGSPEDKKRWMKLVVEVNSASRVSAQYVCYYDYADPNVPMTDTLLGTGSRWDLDYWNDAVWSGSYTSWNDIYLDGVSRNVAVYMMTMSDYYPPHVVSQMYLHYSPRGRRR